MDVLKTLEIYLDSGYHVSTLPHRMDDTCGLGGSWLRKSILHIPVQCNHLPNLCCDENRLRV